MKKGLLILALTLLFAGIGQAQTVCPSGFVCLPQAAANDIFDKLGQLVAAKDLIIKLQTQAGTADTTIANALKVIEGWKELDAVNGQIIVKKDEIIKLYERVMQIQMQIIENLEKRLMKGKSSFDKFIGVLKTIVTFAAGVALGGL